MFNQINQDQLKTLYLLGEDIEIIKVGHDTGTDTYNMANATVHKCKFSAIPATKAAYNLVDREYLFYGDMSLPQDVIACNLRGSYFTRNNMCVNSNKYLLLSIIPEPTNPFKIALVYATQCNEIVEIQKAVQGEFDPNQGIYPIVWETIATIDGYYNTIPRTMKATQDGNFDQSIYSLIIPARYKLSVDMRIVKSTFVKGELAKMAYKVESIDTALMDIDPVTQEIFGVLNCQLSQIGVIINE